MEVKAADAANITLRENTESLGEVVVVGYGTQKKANLTGAVSSVKMDDVLGNRLSVVYSAGSGQARPLAYERIDLSYIRPVVDTL